MFPGRLLITWAFTCCTIRLVLLQGHDILFRLRFANLAEMATFVAVVTFCSTSWTLLTFDMKAISSSLTLLWFVFKPSGCSTSNSSIFCFFSSADCDHFTIRLLQLARGQRVTPCFQLHLRSFLCMSNFLCFGEG